MLVPHPDKAAEQRSELDHPRIPDPCADGGTGEAGVAQSVALRPHQEFLSVGVRQKPTQSPYRPQGEESQPALTADLFFSTGEQVKRDEQQ